MQAQVFTFASSPFVPVAIGFFGLGTGYFIWGGQALFGFPKSSPEVNRTLGLWGFWMPGFMQFRVNLVQRLRQSGAFVHGFPRLHRLRNPLVRDGLPAIYRFQCSAGWMDGNRIPVSQHSWRRRFSPCRRYTSNAYLRRADIDLCDRDSDTVAVLESWWAPRRAGSIRYCYLADVLHIRHDSGFGIGRQGLGIKAFHYKVWPLRIFLGSVPGRNRLSCCVME